MFAIQFYMESDIGFLSLDNYYNIFILDRMTEKSFCFETVELSDGFCIKYQNMYISNDFESVFLPSSSKGASPTIFYWKDNFLTTLVGDTEFVLSFYGAEI